MLERKFTVEQSEALRQLLGQAQERIESGDPMEWVEITRQANSVTPQPDKGWSLAEGLIRSARSAGLYTKVFDHYKAEGKLL